MTKAQKAAKKLKNKKLKEWSSAIKTRAKFKCEFCGQPHKYLNSHHIIGKRYEPLRFNLDNGIALCPTHHKYNYTISAHKNPLAFMIWMEKNRPEQSKKVRELYERS